MFSQQEPGVPWGFHSLPSLRNSIAPSPSESLFPDLLWKFTTCSFLNFIVCSWGAHCLFSFSNSTPCHLLGIPFLILPRGTPFSALPQESYSLLSFGNLMSLRCSPNRPEEAFPTFVP